MVREPQLDNSAPWKQRFRAPIVARARIARLAPINRDVRSQDEVVRKRYYHHITVAYLLRLTHEHLAISVCNL
jgi:hypothetical protein